jgi:hypothetical protein
MTPAQLATIAAATSMLATLALSYFGIPAKVNCTIGFLSQTVAYALTAD